MAVAPPHRLGRRRGDRASPARAVGDRLLHAQGSGRRLMRRRGDGARQVRRAAARPLGRRARARVREAGAVRAARRVQAPGTDDRALRCGCPPGLARAPEGDPRGRGSLRRRPQAAPALPAPPHRHRDRERRSRETRRRDDHPLPLPAGSGARGGDLRSGAARGLHVREDRVFRA